LDLQGWAANLGALQLPRRDAERVRRLGGEIAA
jgi:hypothetical protein